jgi:site-specific DNA recombinase
MRVRARDVFIEAFPEAYRWLDELLSDAGMPLATLAAREHKSERSIRMTLSLVLLAPDLVRAAIDGKAAARLQQNPTCRPRDALVRAMARPRA